MKTQIFLGSPTFHHGIRPMVRGPAGWVLAYEAFHKKYWGDGVKLRAYLGAEYFAIASALRDMGVAFDIILPEHIGVIPGIAEKLRDEGHTFVSFPDISGETLMFPRDLGTVLGGAAFINDAIRNVSLPQEMGGTRVWHSPYGEGGRLLSRGNTIVVARKYFSVHELKAQITSQESLEDPGAVVDVQFLKSLGYNVVILPIPVFFQKDGVRISFDQDDHLDRHAALIEDQHGKLHLFVDPYITSGWKSLDTPPRKDPKETVREIRQACEQVGVTLHVPKRLQVPFSLNLFQAKDGCVLMSKGEPKLQQEIGRLVGPERVITTSRQIAFYPIFLGSGIRCLIGELPECAVNLHPFVTRGWVAENSIPSNLSFQPTSLF